MSSSLPWPPSEIAHNPFGINRRYKQAFIPMGRPQDRGNSSTRRKAKLGEDVTDGPVFKSDSSSLLTNKLPRERSAYDMTANALPAKEAVSPPTARRAPTDTHCCASHKRGSHSKRPRLMKNEFSNRRRRSRRFRERECSARGPGVLLGGQSCLDARH